MGEQTSSGAGAHHEVPSQQITLITKHSPVACITEQSCSTLALSRFYSKVQHVQAKLSQDSADTNIKQGDTTEHSKGPFSEMGSRGESCSSPHAANVSLALCTAVIHHRTAEHMGRGDRPCP